MKLKFLIIIFVLIRTSLIFGQDQVNFHTNMMNSTCKIVGQNGVIGTGFVMFQQHKENDSLQRYLLITAKHVLDNMSGDSAILFIRRKYIGGEYVKYPKRIQIRIRNVNYYVSHPSQDVAVLPIGLDDKASLVVIGTQLLLTEKGFADAYILPGDELFVLGYPLGFEANNVGFPILRSGRISSYPITPIERHPTFLLDFEVFPGNSGGPVYLSQMGRQIGAKTRFDRMYNYILGIVIEETKYLEVISTLDEKKTVAHKLSIAKVISSPVIIETIALLQD